MKAVILAGGYGTRISEESQVRPKPMVEIGGKPILWHIMKIYSFYGINEFIICCGYKGEVIKQYFANYFLNRSDVTFDLRNNEMAVHQNHVEEWRVTLVDTGEQTTKSGRLKRVKDYIDSETFCMTYGDGVADVNISELIKFHRDQNTLATLTAVRPPGRYGAFSLAPNQTKILNFREKAKSDSAWINGGFFVLEIGVLDYIDDELQDWEEEPLVRLGQESMLSSFRHSGFWHPMDSLRDKNVLEQIWAAGNPPWKVW